MVMVMVMVVVMVMVTVGYGRLVGWIKWIALWQGFNFHAITEKKNMFQADWQFFRRVSLPRLVGRFRLMAWSPLRGSPAMVLRSWQGNMNNKIWREGFCYNDKRVKFRTRRRKTTNAQTLNVINLPQIFLRINFMITDELMKWIFPKAL